MAVLAELGLVRSEDLDDVLAAVDYDHAPYAGGTELVPAMGLGLRRPAAIVDLKRVEALKRIEVNAGAGAVSIGSAVTHRRLSDHPGVQEHLPTLAAAASRVGNARVRSTGTVGGNLCFAEPRSDLGCVLLALGASRRTRHWLTRRRSPAFSAEYWVVGAQKSPQEMRLRTAWGSRPGIGSWGPRSRPKKCGLGLGLVQ